MQTRSRSTRFVLPGGPVQQSTLRSYHRSTTSLRGFFVIVYDWAPQNSLLTYPDLGMLFYKWYSILA